MMLWLFAVAGVLAVVGAYQLYRAGAIDTTKAAQVADADAAAVKTAGSSVVAALKKLFHKG